MSILLGNLLIGLAQVLRTVIYFFQILVIVRALLSWVNPDPFNPIVQFINSVTDPILRKVRRYVPPLGMFDISVIVVLLGLVFIDNFLVQSMAEVGARLKGMIY